MDNLFNSLYYSIYLNFYNEKDKTKYYQTHLNKLTSNFALTSNLALLLGGKIKTSQYLSGRYSDILSDLYMSYSCLWYYEKNKHVKDIDKLLKISMNEHFYNIQNSTNLISQNFPNKLLGFLIKFSTYPLGNFYKQSDDKLISDVSNLITTDTEIRDLLTQNIFISTDNEDKLNQISRCFKLISENGDKNDIDKLTQKIIKVDSYKTI